MIPSGVVSSSDYLDGEFTLQHLYNGVNQPTTSNNKILVDSSKNFYRLLVFSGGNDTAVLIKSNTEGKILWRKTLNYAMYTTSLAIDTSDNIYVSGLTPTHGASIIKFNTSGAVVWYKKISLPSGSTSTYLSALQISASGNIYASMPGSISGLEPRPARVVKLDSSGALLWTRTFATNVDYFSVSKIVVDSSESIYVLSNNSPPDPIAHSLKKISSSGNLVWQIALNTSAYVAVTSMMIGPSENLLMLATDASNETFMTTFNPADGSVVSAKNLKYLTSQTSSFKFSDMTSDGIGATANVYTVLTDGTKILNLRLNPSLSIIGQQIIYSQLSNIGVGSLNTTYGSGVIYISTFGASTSNIKFASLRIPADTDTPNKTYNIGTANVSGSTESENIDISFSTTSDYSFQSRTSPSNSVSSHTILSPSYSTADITTYDILDNTSVKYVKRNFGL